MKVRSEKKVSAQGCCKGNVFVKRCPRGRVKAWRNQRIDQNRPSPRDFLFNSKGTSWLLPLTLLRKIRRGTRVRNERRRGEVKRVTLFVTRLLASPVQREPRLSSLFYGNSIFWLSSFHEQGERFISLFSYIFLSLFTFALRLFLRSGFFFFASKVDGVVKNRPQSISTNDP